MKYLIITKAVALSMCAALHPTQSGATEQDTEPWGVCDERGHQPRWGHTVPVNISNSALHHFQKISNRRSTRTASPLAQA